MASEFYQTNVKTQAVMDDPESLMTIYAHVASGGSLLDLCETWGVRFGHIIAWIRSDKERSQAYDAALADRGEWATEVVLREFKRLGTSNLKRLFDEEGQLLPIQDWPDEVASFVAGVDVSVDKSGDTVKKIKLWSKEKALEMYGKKLQFFVQKHEHSGTLTLEDLIEDSREDEGD